MARKKVTSVPALADWGAVDNALRDIRECQHTLAEMAVQRDRQIDSIKADYAQGALPLQNRVKALESEVKAYVDLHRAELDGKSRALNFGTVGYRVSSKLMLASSRVAEAIATLKVLGHAELIKTTETLDREALKRQPGDILQQVGAYIRTVDEFYYDVSSKEADDDDFYRRRTEHGHLALCCGSGCYRERHHRNGGGIAAVRRREVHR